MRLGSLSLTRHYSRTMTNLIPEKRVDKNGVLTTKHVRAGAKPKSSVSALPAPQIAAAAAPVRKYKAPSKRQLTPYVWSFTARFENLIAKAFESPNAPLLESLGVDPDIEVFRFEATEAEMYTMMSRMGTRTALAMLQAGYRTPESSEDFLRHNGHGDLLQQRDIALEAQERRIPISDFIRETSRTSQERMDGEFFMDSMEAAGITALDYYYVSEIREGLIRLADVKAVGATRIKKSDSWEPIREALKSIASGEASYTTDDLKFILDRFSNSGLSRAERTANAITLTDRYGGDFIRQLESLSMPTMDLYEDISAMGFDRDRAASIILYGSKVYEGAEGVYTYSKNYPSAEEIVRFHDAGISVEDVNNKVVTITQLDAIENHGIAPGVSGGWL